MKWLKNGVPLENSDVIEIIEDYEKEFHKVIFKKVHMNDMGDYTVHATNAEGESSTIVKLNPIGKFLLSFARTCASGTYSYLTTPISQKPFNSPCIKR